MEHNNYTRSGFHIWTQTAVQDLDLWEATVYTSDPNLQNRAILIKGPSRCWWFSQAGKYHSDLSCLATKKAHSATVGDIEQDTERHSAYWLLVFPENIVLDNVIFSGDPIGIESTVVGLEAAHTELQFRSEKESTCILPFVHPKVHVITCSSSTRLLMHASTEEFTWFSYVRTRLVPRSYVRFPRPQKASPNAHLFHAH
jgi:hypothetical protein